MRGVSMVCARVLAENCVYVGVCAHVNVCTWGCVHGCVHVKVI